MQRGRPLRRPRGSYIPWLLALTLQPVAVPGSPTQPPVDEGIQPTAAAESQSTGKDGRAWLPNWQAASLGLATVPTANITSPISVRASQKPDDGRRRPSRWSNGVSAQEGPHSAQTSAGSRNPKTLLKSREKRTAFHRCAQTSSQDLTTSAPSTFTSTDSTTENKTHGKRNLATRHNQHVFADETSSQGPDAVLQGTASATGGINDVVASNTATTVTAHDYNDTDTAESKPPDGTVTPTVTSATHKTTYYEKVAGTLARFDPQSTEMPMSGTGNAGVQYSELPNSTEPNDVSVDTTHSTTVAPPDTTLAYRGASGTMEAASHSPTAASTYSEALDVITTVEAEMPTKQSANSLFPDSPAVPPAPHSDTPQTRSESHAEDNSSKTQQTAVETVTRPQPFPSTITDTGPADAVTSVRQGSGTSTVQTAVKETVEFTTRSTLVARSSRNVFPSTESTQEVNGHKTRTYHMSTVPAGVVDTNQDNARQTGQQMSRTNPLQSEPPARTEKPEAGQTTSKATDMTNGPLTETTPSLDPTADMTTHGTPGRTRRGQLQSATLPQISVFVTNAAEPTDTTSATNVQQNSAMPTEQTAAKQTSKFTTPSTQTAAPVTSTFLFTSGEITQGNKYETRTEQVSTIQHGFTATANRTPALVSDGSAGTTEPRQTPSETADTTDGPLTESVPRFYSATDHTTPGGNPDRTLTRQQLNPTSASPESKMTWQTNSQTSFADTADTTTMREEGASTPWDSSNVLFTRAKDNGQTTGDRETQDAQRTTFTTQRGDIARHRSDTTPVARSGQGTVSQLESTDTLQNTTSQTEHATTFLGVTAPPVSDNRQPRNVTGMPSGLSPKDTANIIPKTEASQDRQSKQVTATTPTGIIPERDKQKTARTANVPRVRRSVSMEEDVGISTNTVRLRLAFDADYGACVSGREWQFIAHMHQQMSALMRVPLAGIRNVRVRPGSILLSLDLIPVRTEVLELKREDLEAARTDLLVRVNQGAVTITDLDGRRLPIFTTATRATFSGRRNVVVIIVTVIGVIFLSTILLLCIVLSMRKHLTRTTKVTSTHKTNFNGKSALVPGTALLSRHLERSDGKELLSRLIQRRDSVPDAPEYRPPENAQPPRHVKLYQLGPSSIQWLHTTGGLRCHGVQSGVLGHRHPDTNGRDIKRRVLDLCRHRAITKVQERRRAQRHRAAEPSLYDTVADRNVLKGSQ